MYQPSKKILRRYADVLVNFALGHGKGIKKGEVVFISIPEVANPLLVELQTAILKAGGHFILSHEPGNDQFNFSENFFEHANKTQLTFVPKKYFRSIIDECDHVLRIWGETNKQALKNIDPKKIQIHEGVRKTFLNWMLEEENKGKISWTIALYGTLDLAKEAGISLASCWKQIIRACFLDKKNPVAEWKKVDQKVKKIAKRLNSLPMDRLHMKGPDVDLWIRLGEKRKWASGGGVNLPSFEVFTSPDWRGTEGWIRFNQPLYGNGNRIEGIRLEFKNGKVVRATAKKNEKFLKAMVAVKNADKVGEFSLTDGRHSRIEKFMAETLYDENRGGKYGNTHIALGMAYRFCYTGKASQVSEKEWKRLGYNRSIVHSDIVSTAPRKVTAYLKNGREKVIYNQGSFVL